MTPPVSTASSLNPSRSTSPNEKKRELENRVNALSAQLLHAQRELAFFTIHQNR